MTNGPSLPASEQRSPLSGRDERAPIVDLFKLLLALMVVGVHAPLLTDIVPGGGVFLNQGLYRLAVPAFFCLTAYHLSPTLSRSWARRTRRLVLLFLLWMAIYAPFWLDDLIASDRPALDVIKALLIGYWHLWYLSAICVALPFLAFVLHWRTRHLLLLALSLFLTGLTLQYGTALTQSEHAAELHYWRNGLLFALPFMILGHLLRRHDLPRRLPLRHLLLLVAVGIAALLTEAATLGTFGIAGPSDLRLALLLAVPALVALVLTWADHPVGHRLPQGLGLLATGIYLIHPGLISVTLKLGLPANTLSTLLIILLSAAATWTCVKLRLARFLF